MKTKVYFVRHAQSDNSIREDMIRPLTNKGVEDSYKVTDALMDKNITAIYSSPFKRAIDTIKDFAEKAELEIKIIEDFCERNVGEWVEDFRTYSKRQWEDFYFKISNGESLKEVQERNIKALFKVLEENQGRNVAIGTHGTALCTINNYFNPNFGYSDFWEMIDKMPYILCFSFDGMKLEKIEEIEVYDIN